MAYMAHDMNTNWQTARKCESFGVSYLIGTPQFVFGRGICRK